MKSQSIFRHRWTAATFSCIVLMLVELSHGDGPALKRLFPAGAQRGATVEVSALGEAPKWPVEVWTDDPGIRWEPLSEKGKFRVSIGADVALGKHVVRFYDADNSGDALRFIVGAIPELNELEPNDAVDKTQPIRELPKLINGVLEKRSEVDSFAVELTEGQTLIASVQAQQALQSPLDATLQIVSARGSVLAQNLDTVGLDPRIIFHAPRAGRYFVRVFGFPETPDSTISFAGGENFVYRLSLAHAGFIHSTRPLAVSTVGETKLELIGVALSTTTANVSLPEGTKDSLWQLTLDGAMNALALPILRVPLLTEQPQTAESGLQSLPVPCSITGALDRPRQVDRYRLAAKKDTKLRIELHSREFGYPTDGVLKIIDASGKELVREDDARRDVDARALWQPPADGDYTLEVSDAFGLGGPDWFYRVDIQPVQSDVALSMKADHFQGKVNAPLTVPVSIDRRDGFDRPLRLSVTGLPDTIHCPVLVSEKDGASAKEVTLNLNATAPFSGPVQIIASIESDSQFQRIATAGSDSLVSQIWLIIKP